MARERQFRSALERILYVVCVLTAGYYLYTSVTGERLSLTQRGIILGTCLLLCFLRNPLLKRSAHRTILILDSALALLSVVTVFYIARMEATLPWGVERPVPSLTDIIFGGVLMVLVLEATRRVMGWTMVVLAVVALVYALFGEGAPGKLSHYNFPPAHIIRYVALEVTGIYSEPLKVGAGVLVMFLILSRLIQVGGGSKFFIDLPYSIFGRMRGGPAKIAVVASSLFGTISGSAAANVVATGVFTIPLMKRTGYPSHIAGAVEALASSGGQIMPPIMGVSAFIMAELLGVSYWSICVAAIIPAVIYYVSVFLIVDREAAKRGIKGVPAEELPKLSKVLAGGWFLLVPILLLVILVGVLRWTPETSAFYCIIALVLVSWLGRQKMGLRTILNGLNEAIQGLVLIIVLCAAAGLVIGLIALTGLGPLLSSMLIDLSRGNLVVLLVLTMITSLILGMGLPTAVCYLFLALLVAPALHRMGVPLLAAHLFIFWFGVVSGITPPVAIAAYAAAPLANESPFKIGVSAVKMGSIAYIMPYYFVFNPALIFQGTAIEVLVGFITAVAGAVCFTGAITGYMLRTASTLERVICGIAGFVLLAPGWTTAAVGFALLGLVAASQRFRGGAARSSEASSQFRIGAGLTRQVSDTNEGQRRGIEGGAEG